MAGGKGKGESTRVRRRRIPQKGLNQLVKLRSREQRTALTIGRNLNMYIICNTLILSTIENISSSVLLVM